MKKKNNINNLVENGTKVDFYGNQTNLCRGVNCTSSICENDPICVGAAFGSPFYEEITQKNKEIFNRAMSTKNGRLKSPLHIHCYSSREGAINKNAGITLVALIITIILLLILAGVTLQFTLGENGILRNVGIAGNKYKQEEQKEKNALDEMYSSILVAEGSKVTLTMEQLDEYIKMKEQEINSTKCSITVTSENTYKSNVAQENINVVLDNIQGNAQNKFILENGKIKIGKDIKRIFVSVYAFGMSNVMDSGLEVWALKNESFISSNFCRANSSAKKYPILTYPTIINVEEGDYISVGGCAWTGQRRII